jgi:hypothetical protein
MKQGQECAFMGNGGCSANGGNCEPIVEKCVGCERTKEFEGQKFCASYPEPSRKWAHGVCNFATHVRATVDKEGKIKVNPLKASKRAARGR